jgi:digeranylgeranylglycerophospholipid reductase
MKEYDVIVVGAGPAGSEAAKTAAEGGVKTILIEEHTRIGIPQHCSGLLFGTRSGIGEEILATMDRRVVLSAVTTRRLFSPKGRVIEIPLKGKGVWLLDRALFDMHLAAQAADAGAEIVINTKVTGLSTRDNRVIGVKTNSKRMPEIYGKVVIGADGIKSLLGGIPKWSGMTKPVKRIMSGMTWWLANVKDVEEGVQELHIGRYGGKTGWIWLERWDATTCLADFDNLEDFEKCRQGDSILSTKIKDAVPVRITGWAQPFLGKPLPQKVKSGLILAGAAAKYYPFVTCLLSGRFAGKTAVEAVMDGDTGKERLSSYNILCEKLQEPKPEIGFASFGNLSEIEQEELFDRMTQMDDLNFDVLSI